MTTQTEALKLLVEALSLYETRSDGLVNKALAAGKKALAQPEQCKYGQEPKSCTSNPMDCQCALDAALAQPAVAEQHKQSTTCGEPVAHFGSAYINENGVHITTVLGPVAIPQDAKLYTTPPQCKEPEQEPVAHWSDCAVHSEPAYPKGECDCGGLPPELALYSALKYLEQYVREKHMCGPVANELLANARKATKNYEAAHGIKE